MTNLEIVSKVIAEVFTEDKKAKALWWSGNDQVLIATSSFGVKFSDIKSLEQKISDYGGNVEDIDVSPMPKKNYALALKLTFANPK